MYRCYCYNCMGKGGYYLKHNGFPVNVRWCARDRRCPGIAHYHIPCMVVLVEPCCISVGDRLYALWYRRSCSTPCSTPLHQVVSEVIVGWRRLGGSQGISNGKQIPLPALFLHSFLFFLRCNLMTLLKIIYKRHFIHFS